MLVLNVTKNLLYEVFECYHSGCATKLINHNSDRTFLREQTAHLLVGEQCFGRKYHLDIPEDDEYQTLAGYILVKTGEIPAENEKISLGEYEFEILKKSANRLELIKVKESGAGEKEEK